MTISGTALAGVDYLPVPRTTITFLPGVTQQVLAVPIISDTQIESDEIVYVLLTNAMNASLATAIGIGTIINDDSNYPPTVTITNPINSAVFFTPPGIIPICADARDLNGTVRQVDFYSGTNSIGRSTNSPFCMVWTNNVVGAYLLTAIAIDNDGARATSAPVSITIQTCGQLSVAALVDQTNCVCETVTISTTVISTAPYSIVWKANGRVIPEETGTNLVLHSLKPSDAGDYSVQISTPCQTVTRSNKLTISGASLQNPAIYANTNLITINDFSPATPFPSAIDVRCVPGVLTNLTVTLYGLSHDFPGDVDIMLVSPNGRALMLMSDLQDDLDFPSPLQNLTLTFSDAAAQRLPTIGPIISGTYKPTDFPGGGLELSAPAGAILVTNLAAFGGLNPNGVWGLTSWMIKQSRPAQSQAAGA